MVQSTIRLAKPFISEEAIRLVNDVLRSGNLVQGEYVLKFETALATYLGCEHVVVVSSGTAALHLALIAAGIGQDDEVIVPAFTFPATANVVELVGATPVLVDIGLDDFCIDVSKIEQAITSKTKAIMPVHEFGQAAGMQPLLDIAEKHKIVVLEDAACGLGTEYNIRKAGTFGAMGCFSFHPRKAITTGEGGAITTNDPDLTNTLRALRNHGMVNQNGKIDFNFAGYNYRLTDFQAVLGIAQLQNFDETIEARQLQALALNKAFDSNTNITSPKSFSNRRHTYQTYHVMLNPAIDRDTTIKKIQDKGIETNYGAYALQTLSYYQKKYKLTNSSYPNALYAQKHGIAIPVGSHISDDELTHIMNTVNELLK